MLQIQNISKSYGAQKVLDRVSLNLSQGQRVALLGPSGCGKSTLLKAIAGLVTPSEGRIIYLGQDITEVPAHRRKIPLVFQDHLLFPHLTVAGNIAFGLKATDLSPKEIKHRIDESLDLIQLTGFGHRYPSQISGGQRQRVALARAMVLRPQLILLDEPLSNLDASLRIDMRRLITHSCRTYGTSMILVTHDPQEALNLGDYLAVMTGGRLWEFAPAAQMYQTPKTLVSAKMMGFENRLPHFMGDYSPSPPHPDDPSTAIVLRPEDLQVSLLKGEPRRESLSGSLSGSLTGRLLCLEFEGSQGRASFETSYGPLEWRGPTQSALYQILGESQGKRSQGHSSPYEWQLSWDPHKTLRVTQTLNS